MGEIKENLTFDDIKDGKSISAKKWQLPFGACSLNISAVSFYDVLFGEKNPKYINFLDFRSLSAQKIGITNFTRDVVALSNANSNSFFDRYKYTVEVANPIYDSRSRASYIPIFTEDFGKNYVNAFDENYSNAVAMKNGEPQIGSLFRELFNKQWKKELIFEMVKYYTGWKSDGQDYVGDADTLTFTEFVELTKNYKPYGDDGITGWEVFQQDFSLKFHDKESIKYPYFENDIDNVTKKQMREKVRYGTRFYANSINQMPELYYQEYLDLKDEQELIKLNNSGSINYSEGIADTSNDIVTFGNDDTNRVNDSTSYHKNSLSGIIHTRLADISNNEDSSSDVLDLIVASDAEQVPNKKKYIYFFDEYDIKSNEAISEAFEEYGLNTSEISTWYKFNLSDMLVDHAFYARNFYMWSNFAFRMLDVESTVSNTMSFNKEKCEDIGGGALAYGRVQKVLEVFPKMSLSTEISDPSDVNYAITAMQYDRDTTVMPAGWKGQNWLSSSKFCTTMYKILSASYNIFDNGKIDGNDNAKDILVSYLKNEDVLIKIVGFGDLIEPDNFNQDLNQESSPVFKNILLNKNAHNSKYSDSAPTEKYIMQTVPLEDTFQVSTDDVETLIKNDLNFSSAQVDANAGAAPADMLYRNNKFAFNEIKDSHVNAGPSRGNVINDGKIISPTIDDIWVFFKRLVEDYDENALPTFHGIKGEINNEAVTNGLAKGQGEFAEVGEAFYDVLKWHQNTEDLHDGADTDIKVVTGFTIDDSIKFIPEYFSTSMFAVREKKVDGYEKIVGDLGKKIEDGESSSYIIDPKDTKWVDAAYLFPAIAAVGAYLNTGFADESDPIVYDREKYKPKYNEDENVEKKVSISDIIPGRKTIRREEIGSYLRDVFFYGEDEEEHFKDYLDRPMNLRFLERSLERLSENIYEYARVINATFAPLGWADSDKDIGTIGFLHKNHTTAESTEIKTEGLDYVDEIAYADGESTVSREAEVTVSTDATLNIVVADRQVIYDDGVDVDRHTRNKYGQTRIVLQPGNQNITEYLYKKNALLEDHPTRAQLSEIYLAADGTWRDVNEHVRVPILDCDY